MFCILVFVIFLFLFPIFGIFSKDYRTLFKNAWACAFKKLTLKPCEVNFGEELKTKLLSSIAFRFPSVARFIDKTATFWALAFVALSVWSLLYAANAGLNLWVYDTCDPTNGESCALGGETCGINTITTPTIWETISRIPDRLKTWVAEEYIGPNPTYYKPYDNGKPTAVEFIDPGCTACKSLWNNIKEAGLAEKYNLTYVMYPIASEEGYKYQHSYLIASWLEATKLVPSGIHTPSVIADEDIPNDWKLLEIIYTDEDEIYNTSLQNAINMLYSSEDVVAFIKDSLREFGYSEEQITQIEALTTSEEVSGGLAQQRIIVEEQLRTIKIPTIVFGGRRYDRVVDVETLKH